MTACKKGWPLFFIDWLIDWVSYIAKINVAELEINLMSNSLLPIELN